MEFDNMSSVDLKMNLLSGSAINVGNISIKPFTLREIKDYGYTEYINNIQWISINLEEFINHTVDDDKRDILKDKMSNLKTFDFYIKLGGREFLEKLIEAMSMIFRTNDFTLLHNGLLVMNFYKMGILYDDENGLIHTDEEVLRYYSNEELKVINRENFDKIVEVVKMQNYISKPKNKVEEENPADEETRLLIEEMKRNREKVEAKKRQQQESDNKNEDIDITDIISAVSSKSNSINKLNIWDLTLYQLYDEYSRLELIDNYDFSIKAVMAGAEKVDVKHWSSKL